LLRRLVKVKLELDAPDAVPEDARDMLNNLTSVWRDQAEVERIADIFTDIITLARTESC
jgi:hypothetical protein